jgi:hypothetical protein
VLIGDLDDASGSTVSHVIVAAVTFDKFVSLGGGSEEISEICVVCLGSLMLLTEVQQQAVQARTSLIVGEVNSNRPL